MNLVLCTIFISVVIFLVKILPLGHSMWNQPPQGSDHLCFFLKNPSNKRRHSQWKFTMSSLQRRMLSFITWILWENLLCIIMCHYISLTKKIGNLIILCFFVPHICKYNMWQKNWKSRITYIENRGQTFLLFKYMTLALTLEDFLFLYQLNP